MEIQEREESNLYEKLESEEFSCDRRKLIRKIEEILWEWNQKEQRQQKRLPLKYTTGRVKTPGSIVEKLKRKGYDVSLQGVEQLHDLSGVRAVCSYLDDVYRLRDYLLSHREITVLQEKDYIACPKETGYQSLHMILKMDMGIAELQIRTVAMDYWSNLEHPVIYKQGINADKQIGKKLTAYAGFLRRVDGMLLEMRIEQEKEKSR